MYKLIKHCIDRSFLIPLRLIWHDFYHIFLTNFPLPLKERRSLYFCLPILLICCYFGLCWIRVLFYYVWMLVCLCLGFNSADERLPLETYLFIIGKLSFWVNSGQGQGTLMHNSGLRTWLKWKMVFICYFILFLLKNVLKNSRVSCSIRSTTGLWHIKLVLKWKILQITLIDTTFDSFYRF